MHFPNLTSVHLTIYVDRVHFIKLNNNANIFFLVYVKLVNRCN